MLLTESYKKRIQELAGIISEDNSTAFAASDTRIPFDLDLMTQAINQGREVGLLYKGDEMSAPSGKYRLIYPVAMGISKAGNRVVRAIHKVGQSESVAKRTGVRSAEAKNVWRLFKVDNIKGMWFTGNFFRGPLNGYNPNDKGMTTVEVATNLSKVVQFQDELFRKQKEEGEKQAQLKRFKERGERPLEQPIQNPETRISSEPEGSEQQD
jgi:hypothetical protein